MPNRLKYSANLSLLDFIILTSKLYHIKKGKSPLYMAFVDNPVVNFSDVRARPLGFAKIYYRVTPTILKFQNLHLFSE